MKVALVHDYLREYGGAEKVVEVLHEMFPDAPVYTAYYNPQKLGIHAQRFKDWDIRTSWMQKVPFANSLLSPFRIFAPMMFESFDLSEYDVVISSSAIYFAKAVITKPQTRHIAYIHTPPKYLYGYTTSFNYKKRWRVRIGAETLNHFLRLLDFETSQRPDILVANSQAVAARINKFYRREAAVIYPPVDVDGFKSTKPKSTGDNSYFLCLNRLWKGKGTDIVVKACTDLGLSLKVAGTGPERENLKQSAGSTIEFLGAVTDEEKCALYAGAKALIVATEDEDFGITVVEAMAAGTPVIALRRGGYLETVVEGTTGEFFDPSAPSNVADANSVDVIKNLEEVLKRFDPKKYKAADCKKQAEKFSKERFKKEVIQLLAISDKR